MTLNISFHILLTFDRSKDAKRDIVEVDAFHQEGLKRIQNVQGCGAPPLKRHPEQAVQERRGKMTTQIKITCFEDPIVHEQEQSNMNTG